MIGEEHAGYLDIKLPQKSRYKRTKVWCNRWVMLHKVSDLSVAKMLAKLDIYTHAEYAGSPDKKISSMLLENVTSIKSISTSRTHPHAFEICEAGNPVLYFSAATLTETRLWASFLREIFNLNSLDTAGLYCVWIRENDYSDRLGLFGDYLMTITSTNINITKTNGQGNFQWSLSSLKKLYTRPVVPEAKHNHILIIEPDESLVVYGNFVMFVTPRAEEILMKLRTNIFMNTKVKSRNRTIPTNRTAPQYNRYNSLPPGFDPETISLYDLQNFSIDHERAMSVFEPQDNELQEMLNRDISISVPPPKPARNLMYTPTSDTPSSWEENKETTEDSSVEFTESKSTSQRSGLEDKQCDCDSDPQLKLVTPCQGDENNDQKFKFSLPNNLGSRDSGVLSITSETGSVDLRQQTVRSNSGDSAISLLIDRQKTITQTNEPIPENFAMLECSSQSSESDKESDDYSGSHIYWDIEPQELDIPQTEILPRKSSTSISRCHSLQNLLPNSTNDYEDLADLSKEKKDVKNAPPALPKRPKSLAFSKDKGFLKTSMKERFLGPFSYISPQIKRKIKSRKTVCGADDLNMIIKDFRKWSVKEKETEWEETNFSETEHVSERTPTQKKDPENWQKRKIQHSWSTSDATDLSWNDEETKDGVFVVERKVDPLAFLKRDPFRLLSNKHMARQNLFDVRHSTIDTENDDLSPVLSPVIVHSLKTRDFNAGHWSDGDTKGSDGEWDLDEFPPNRRRSISLEAKLEYQVMIRQLKKDLRETTDEQPLTNADPSLHTTHKMSALSNPPTFSSQATTDVTPNPLEISKPIFPDYIEMSGRIRSSSVCEVPSQHAKVNQKRTASFF